MLVNNPNDLPTTNIRTIDRLQDKLKDINKKNAEKLRKSIDRDGYFVPVFVWQKPDGKRVLLDGHTRKFVIEHYNLDDDGKIEVPYVLINAEDEAEAKRKLLEISSQYGKITQEGYDEFTADLPEAELLDVINFDALPLLGSDQDNDAEQDEPPDLRGGAASSALGTVYRLGRHKLMCGDATNGEAVNKLLGGDSPTLMVTDPPYGVSYDADWRDETETQRANSRTGDVLNDDRADWTAAYELFGGDVAYVWHSALHTHEVADNLINLGYKLIAQIIWVKQHLVLSRGDYHWQHEPCWYAVKEGSKHNWQGDRKQTTTWEVANSNPFTGNANVDDGKTEHGAQKPVECMARPIKNNSGTGDGVYDPFGGSGTTLIACEQLDRTCYMMELDANYCDVIRKRYAKFTNPEKWEEEWEALTPPLPS